MNERMAKVRAAKAQKRGTTAAGKPSQRAGGERKATPVDYQMPIEKVLKGPRGEVVRVGERGANFYINRNGNKTYLSSNE